MEPEGPLLCTQEPASGPYPEPDESNLHSPRSRVIQNLIFTQRVKELSAFYGSRKFITVFTTAVTTSYRNPDGSVLTFPP